MVRVASYLVLMQDDKALLARRYNTGYADGMYSLVSGHVDKGETFTEAMLREAKEEAGIIIDPKDLEVVHVMQRGYEDNMEYVDVYFKVTKWQGNVENKEPTKCDDLSWFSINNLPENTLPYIKNLFTHIKNGVIFSEKIR